jgi:4-amino-4-deoxy-L-arabinose transferase-like glycosyltransferase
MSAASSPASAHGATAPHWGLWLLLAALWCASLPLRPLLDPDEGRYAEIPREMWASGDWVTPRLDGLKYFEKPALQYWATAAFYTVFGVHEWTSRLFGAGLAFLCLPLVYGFVRRLGRPPDEGLLAAAVLAINPYFSLIGHINLLDQSFSFLVVAAMFCFVLAQCEATDRSRQRAWMLAAWAGLALAMLAKGLAAIVLTAAALGLYMLVQRDFSPLRRMHFMTGVPLFLLIAAPWFVVVQLRNPEFSGFFFVHEHFSRFLTTVHRRAGPVWYFVPYVLLALLPFLLSSRDALRRAWQQAPIAGNGFRADRFLLAWCAGTLLFFSVSQSKLPPYILPIMPVLAVLLAPALRADALALRRATWVQSGLLLLLAIGLAVDHLRGGEALAPLLVGWTVVAALAALAPLLWTRFAAPAGGRAWVPLAIAALVGWQALLIAYSHRPPLRSASEMAAAARPHVGPATELFSVRQYRHSASFYLGRTLRIVDYTGELEFGLGREDRGQIADLDAFRRVWQQSTDAVAFIDPPTFVELQRSGFPGRQLAADARSVLVSRQ